MALSFIAASLLAALSLAQSLGPVATPADMSRGVAPLVDRVKDSVVTIRSTKIIRRMVREDPYWQFFHDPAPREQTQQSLGSGFIIDTQGTILTNNHVVAGADEVMVLLSDERRFEARVVGADPATDVAVVKLRRAPRDLRPVALGDSERVRVGDYVLAIGNPLGLGQTVTMGIVSAKNRALAGKLIDLEDFIQTDAAINQGNSGGPLFNFAGQVVGINSAILNPAMAMNVGFAIPINMAQQIAEQLVRSGRVLRGRLGVVTDTFTPERARDLGMSYQAGALINMVQPGSPAAKAGLRPNDVIVDIGGRRIDDPARVRQSVAARRPGETVKIAVLRGSQRIETQVVLDENEALRGGGTTILGITVQPISRREAEALGAVGLKVLSVDPQGPASGSLQEDDVLIGVDREPATLESLKDLERRFKTGGAGRIIVQRGPYQMVLTIRG